MRKPHDESYDSLNARKNKKDNVHSMFNGKNIKPMSFKDFSKLTFPPQRNVLSPWLPEAGLAMVIAESGAGKTYFCLNCAMAIAAGKVFLDFKAEKPQKVLYIDGEMRADKLQERLLSIAENYPDMDPDNVHLITPENMPGFAVPKLCNPNVQSWIDNMIREFNYDVIFFDNLSTLMEMDENNASEWNVIQDWFIRIRSMGCAVVLVHHTGANVDKQRGSSKHIDVLDTAILLKKGLTNDPTIPLYFNISYQKARNFWGVDTLPFDAYMTKDGSWIMKDTNNSTMEKVAELFNLGMKQVDIARELRINQSNVCRSIQKAISAGLILK